MPEVWLKLVAEPERAPPQFCCHSSWPPLLRLLPLPPRSGVDGKAMSTTATRTALDDPYSLTTATRSQGLYINSSFSTTRTREAIAYNVLLLGASGGNSITVQQDDATLYRHGHEPNTIAKLRYKLPPLRYGFLITMWHKHPKTKSTRRLRQEKKDQKQVALVTQERWNRR